MTDINEIVMFMDSYMKEESLKTFADRMLLVINELGSIAKIYTHDTTVNPKARPVSGTMEAEFGDAIMMLFSAAGTVGVDMDRAVAMGMERLKNKEWMGIKHQKLEGACYNNGTNVEERGM